MAESKAKSKGELPCPEMARWQGPCALASHSCAMGAARAGVGRTHVALQRMHTCRVQIISLIYRSLCMLISIS
jgi:hypothetical protein